MNQNNYTGLLWAAGAIIVYGLVKWIIAHWPKPKPDRMGDIVRHLATISDTQGSALRAIENQTVEMLQGRPTSISVPEPVLNFFNAWMEATAKQQAAQVNQQAALDLIVIGLNKQSEYIKLFCRTLSPGGGGYKEVDDEEEMILNRAADIQRRYGLNEQEALKRARAVQAYQPNGGGGMEDSV